MLKPKPNCLVCGSPNANGYDGVEYDDLQSFERMECDTGGATWRQLWVRGAIDDVKNKTAHH